MHLAPGKDGLQVAQRRRVEGGKHDQNWLRRGRGGLVFHFNTSAFGTMGEGESQEGGTGGQGGQVTEPAKCISVLI